MRTTLETSERAGTLTKVGKQGGQQHLRKVNNSREAHNSKDANSIKPGTQITKKEIHEKIVRMVEH